MFIEMYRILSRIAAAIAPALMLPALAACVDSRNAYSEYHQLDSAGWRYDDAAIFTPEHADSLCEGPVVVALRHDSTYPYTDVWLEVSSEATGRCDTLDIPVVDEYGNWLGSGIGASFQLSDTVGKLLHPSGTPITVRHIMRTDTLRGINQVGLFFEPHKN